jgi:hypothetical protein
MAKRSTKMRKYNKRKTNRTSRRIGGGLFGSTALACLENMSDEQMEILCFFSYSPPGVSSINGDNDGLYLPQLDKSVTKEKRTKLITRYSQYTNSHPWKTYLKPLIKDICTEDNRKIIAANWNTYIDTANKLIEIGNPPYRTYWDYILFLEKTIWLSEETYALMWKFVKRYTLTRVKEDLGGSVPHPL